MPNEHNPTNDQQNPKPEFVIAVPVILRALASYLEVPGESEKFSNHLNRTLQESGLGVDKSSFDANVLNLLGANSGERPGQMG